MMKFLFVVLSVIGIFSCKDTYALTYEDTFDEEGYLNAYVVKEKNGVRKYQQMRKMMRMSDKELVYCIEPGISIDGNKVVSGSDIDQAYFAKLSTDVWNRISLLAYYGYGYHHHTDIKWYIITQYLIWKTVPNGYDIYFTDTLNGKRVEKYTSEINELETLVKNHLVKPSFDDYKINMQLGEVLTLVDSNNVLSLYDTNSGQLSTKSEGNNLIINANIVGNSTITLTKEDKMLLHPAIIYYDPISQDVMVRGSYDAIKSQLDVNVTGGSITINKKDIDTQSNKSIISNLSLEGAVYGIYLENGDKITSVVTNTLGQATATLPYLGKYYIQEEVAPYGYEIDTNKYYFSIDKDKLDEEIVVFDSVIRAYVKLIKTDKDTGKPIPISKIKFKIKNLDTDEYVCINNSCEYETEEDGTFTTISPLQLGKYSIEEVNQKIDGYLWNSEAKEFEIKDNSLKVIKFYNTSVKGEVEVKKLGEELVLNNGFYYYNEILLDGVEISLYANEDIYYCSELIYKKNQKITTFKTSNGYYKLDNLHLGKYYILEEATVNNHVIDNKKYEFELSYKNQYTSTINYKLTIKNYLPKVSLDFTKKDFYTNEHIKDTLIEIYTKDNILIHSGRTDEDGKITLNDLFLGEFYLIEKEASLGYIKTDEVIEFNATYDNQSISLEMYNEKYIEVPHTNVEADNNNNINYLYLFSSSLFLIYTKKVLV